MKLCPEAETLGARGQKEGIELLQAAYIDVVEFTGLYPGRYLLFL